MSDVKQGRAGGRWPTVACVRPSVRPSDMIETQSPRKIKKKRKKKFPFYRSRFIESTSHRTRLSLSLLSFFKISKFHFTPPTSP